MGEKYETWEQLNNAFPMTRHDMTEEEEREYVDNAFRLFEEEGFADRFWTWEEDFGCYNGQRFQVLRRAAEYDVVWVIQFDNGDTIRAFPDEIIKSEMIENGCPLWNDKGPHLYKTGVMDIDAKLNEMFGRYIDMKYYNQKIAKPGSHDDSYSAGEIAEAEKWLEMFGADLSYEHIQTLVDA